MGSGVAAAVARMKAATATRQDLLRQLGDLVQERVGRSEPQSNTGTNNEGRVDQTCQQEHLGLQLIHQLGLAGCRFEVLAAHDADADAGAESTQTNDQTSGEGNKANDFHDDSFLGL